MMKFLPSPYKTISVRSIADHGNQRPMVNQAGEFRLQYVRSLLLALTGKKKRQRKERTLRGEARK